MESDKLKDLFWHHDKLFLNNDNQIVTHNFKV
jgi:hypothetical protein